MKVRLSSGVRPSQVQAILDNEITIPTRSKATVLLEEVDGSEVVVRVQATPELAHDGAKLADEVIAALSAVTGEHARVDGEATRGRRAHPRARRARPRGRINAENPYRSLEPAVNGDLRAHAADERKMTCDHTGPHSGVSKYLRETAELRLTLVCDQCGAERSEYGRIDYRPHARRFSAELAEMTARELGLDEPRWRACASRP